jgi:hypothetical protein
MLQGGKPEGGFVPKYTRGPSIYCSSGFAWGNVLEVACEHHTRMWDGVRAGEKASGDQGVVCGWRRMIEYGGSRLQNRHGTHMLCWRRV